MRLRIGVSILPSPMRRAACASSCAIWPRARSRPDPLRTTFALYGNQPRPRRVASHAPVSYWAATAAFDPEGRAPQIAASFELLFRAVGALALDPPREEIHLIYIGAANPLNAAAAALGATAVREIPRLRFHSVELPPEVFADSERLAEITAAEQATAGAHRVRYQVTEGRLERQELDWESYRPEIEPPAISDDGAYLVTGGLGRIGRHAAQFLAEHGARHIVLCGRRVLSAEEERKLAPDSRISRPISATANKFASWWMLSAAASAACAASFTPLES